MLSRSGSEATAWVPSLVTRRVPPERGGGGTLAVTIVPNVGAIGDWLAPSTGGPITPLSVSRQREPGGHPPSSLPVESDGPAGLTPTSDEEVELQPLAATAPTAKSEKLVASTEMPVRLRRGSAALVLLMRNVLPARDRRRPLQTPYHGSALRLVLPRRDPSECQIPPSSACFARLAVSHMAGIELVRHIARRERPGGHVKLGRHPDDPPGRSV
jgi:hypothetical protein